MKHIFVVNPHAGKQNSLARVTQMVADYAASHPSFDYFVYTTQAPGDATVWTRQYCLAHPDDALRFYACGGDGTLNEVLSGIMGHAHAQLSCLPIGSGNDFVKYYGGAEAFGQLDRLVEGTPYQVDVMQVGDRYSINVTNFGFDAEVCRVMDKVRRIPLIGGRNAYTTGILKSLVTARHNYIRMTIDGQPFYDGPMLLSTLSNGQYVGGSYRCAPLSHNDDGLLEIYLFKCMPVLTLAGLIGDYAHGTHIHNPKAQKYIIYQQGTRVELSSPTPFWLVLDGELVQGTHFTIQNLHHAITFVGPRA